MDPVALLEPRSDDPPSGENLEYDPVFVEMELAAQPGEETQFDDGDSSDPPDYKEVIEKAEEVMQRSHDLRAAVYIADALLNTEGIAGFADATAYVRGCLEKYWDTCHPELDEDDDNDPTMRINAVQGLCGHPEGQSGPSLVYRSLRRAPLSESRGFGRFSIRDIEIAEGQVAVPEDMENVPDPATIAAAFKDSDADTLAKRLEAAKSAAENLKAISKVFDEKTPGDGPELDPVIKLAESIARTIASYSGSEEAVADLGGDDTAGAGGDAPAPMGGGGGQPVGGIRNTNDVSNALDRIIDYYNRNEPSSPIPLLLKRAQRLVNADFLTIVQDMAPGGIDNVHLIGGIDE